MKELKKNPPFFYLKIPILLQQKYAFSMFLGIPKGKCLFAKT